ncbi:ribonucleotide-diphosphate reductase subunit beta [Faecalibacter rhinopitheci]|uniref:ribonucleoside-diphosphate reductase n=1 Tax=Faecalibacter rhinopitheci TaxID=2779678 RepID=A0A8J7K3A5_9FLAO|nr:ribonucleotide-diphosphate reductase subunit beta [Faecalibacter rhinopitheci]MBF0596318.1 ribonucleotide-diphosphate reductase subunit beta [Faecalibacter rhinopitheci]
MSIFDKRINYKPFEYPEVLTYTEAIQKAYWVHTEVDFTSDIQDYRANLDDVKREIHKRSILSIAQIEVSVKGFWGDLYNYFPKPELNGLGATFAESEFRHSEAYSRILEVNGYLDEFSIALENPVFKSYNNFVSGILKDTEISIVEKLLFFALVIEDSSLFSKFANILSFTRFEGLMKNTANIIAWTSVDEQIHANAGIYLINKIKEEGLLPPSLDQSWVENAVTGYIEQEKLMLDWIFEKGELEHYSKIDLLNYMKYRLDEAIEKIGYKKVFHITQEQYRPMAWFEEEVFASTLDDFFAKRPVDYTKHDKSISADDLF